MKAFFLDPSRSCNNKIGVVNKTYIIYHVAKGPVNKDSVRYFGRVGNWKIELKWINCKCRHYFNNDKACPFEGECRFRHEPSKRCRDDNNCKRSKCQFQHQGSHFLDQDNGQWNGGGPYRVAQRNPQKCPVHLSRSDQHTYSIDRSYENTFNTHRQSNQVDQNNYSRNVGNSAHLVIRITCM